MPKNTRVKISSVVKNQLPDFIRADFPLAGEFLAQYYTALEGQGSTLDVLQNIDKYIKVDELTDLIESTNLSTNVGIADNTITVDSTTGFPDSFGLLEIDSEIITYTGITTNSFTGCSRGFSGITSYRNPNHTDELVFTNSGISTHSSGSVVNNLSIRFLQEFFKKVKKQITPGFEERTLSSDINKRLFLKQSKDFYSSKGTDKSFEILFRALYGEDVNVLKPRDSLFIPSASNYKISEQLVVEPIDGDPADLINRNLFQDSDGIFPKAIGAINDVEKIIRDNKVYYKVSLDYTPTSSRVTGKFSIHPNTKLVDSISIGSTVMSVDSTVGFGTAGTLLANFDDGTSSTITYDSKSFNQFYGCSGIDRSIDPTQDLLSSSYAYGYSGVGTANVVKVRVTGVLSKLDYAFQGNYNTEVGDIIKPKGLGSNVTNIVNKSLFNNISITYDVQSIDLIDKSNFTYKLTLFDNHIFVVGDNALINDVQCSIISLISSKEVLVKGAGELSSNTVYRIKRLLSKANLSNYPSANIFSTNIQNSYSDGNQNTYIASPSIPNYFNEALDIRKTDIIFSGSFNNSTEITIPSHGLITGEKVTYVGGSGDNKLDITQDEYFIKKIDVNTIKLSKSSANINNNVFVSFSGSVSDNIFKISNFYQKNIKSQKLLRKIHASIPSKFSNPTRTGKTGILVNGVEIVNYKSNDVVNYGPLEEISVVSEGKFYDIVNPPIVSVSDAVGTGCSAFCEVQGSIKRIDVEDGGFDYLTVPTIKITGGNGKGCIASPNLIAKDHNVEFNSIETAGLVNLTSNTIGFSTFHKFRDGELVSYNTEGQTAISGLTTNAAYFCCVKNATTVSLHKNYGDAIAGVSTISLTAYGVGIQELKCQSKKRIISSVSIGNSGSLYTNRLTSINPSGINTASNKISIKNHGYSDGEIIRYDTKGTVISGLATLTDYYVTKVDGDSFKLSAVGVGSTPANFYIRNKKYINLTDGGLGFHEFNYPPIKVTVDGNIGVSTFSGQDFNAKLRPVGKGSIKSVYVVDGGVGYGSSDVINYNRQPTFSLKSGKDAQLFPVVSVEGKITEVIVLNSGTEYNSAPILSAYGEGNGCVLLPILKSGAIESVKVIHSGIGYTSSNTNVFVTPNGRECDLYANPKTWVINSFERLLQNDQITSDDGIVTNGLNSDYQLQYSHLYAPRKLRQSTYLKKTVGDKEVFVPDLRLENDIEQTSGVHSPILGWSYDGSPIYGPYGYSTNSGGSIKIIESGYSVSISSYRPNPLTSDGKEIYPNGFFVEDYVHSTDKDLDEHNGRFCKTPEYPNGIYAYFSTINPTVRDSEGSFKNYRRPQFPYFIGNSYKYEPIQYNFEGLSNQDNTDLNKTNLVRNTDNYNFLFNKTKYDFLINPSNINEQKTYVTETSAGSLSNIGVSTGGYNYRIGDYVVFDNEGSSGYGAHATVGSIQGKTINQISVANTVFSNVEFIPDEFTSKFVGYTTIPHNLYQNEFVVISGLNTNGLSNNYIQPVGIRTEQFKLFGDVAGISTTGIVTFFNVIGNLEPNFIRENDILGIGTEKIKVLNVDKEDSRIRIIRQYDSTIGSSHTSFSLISQNPRRLHFSPLDPQNKSDYTLNRELYFNPKESVSLGNVSGVGIGSTLFFSNPGTGISEIFVPTKSIYFKDHGLKSGDALTYRTNEGTALGVSTDGTMEFILSNEQTLYAAPLSKDLIGIATARVGVGSTGSFVGINSTTNISTLFFTGIGTGLYHSFKTNYSNVLSGQLNRSLVTVSTSSTHGLRASDSVTLKVNPGITTTIKVAYNDYNRRLVINPRSFSESDIDVSSNSITISKHGYVNGQKIVSTATTSPGGLTNNGIYYVYVVDQNTIKLCNEFYESINLTPNVINITSSYAGKISSINPRVIIERNQQVDFDLSDSSLSFVNNEVSYSAFDFNLYSDIDLNNLFFTSGKTDDFNISLSGRIGIDATAVLTIKNVEQIQKDLYYNLTPINDDLNTDIKKEIIRDTDNNVNSNSLVFSSNPLTGSHTLVGVGSTTFLFSAPKSPKKLEYSSSDGDFSYDSSKTKAQGPIAGINLRSKGKQYRTIPGISTIRSYEGRDAILKPESTTIGRISNVDIQNIGFDYSADNTLRPQAQIPHLIKIDALASIKSIGISSVGTNYLSSPGLVVLDGLTNKEVSEIDLDYELGDTHVTILKNSKFLNDIVPKIIPISNSNGITINNIDYNSGTGDVTVTIGASFSDAAEYPFEVGKKVMIEGVSVGLGSTGKGYNSVNYNYKLFEILATDPNIGGTLGTVRYSLSNTLGVDEIPGTFKSASSFGKIVPEEYFPTFDVKIEQNRFEVGETLVSGNKTAVLQSWNKLNDYIKISSSFDFEVGETLFGESSKTKAIISEYTSYNTLYDIGSSSIVNEGWQTNSGFLNDNQQRIFDSEYYQYFSYSLQSEVQYTKWDEPVSTLNHTSGFKKFSDLIVRSETDAGISTIQDQTSFDVVTDLISVMDLNTVFDFDLVREKTLNIDSKIVSDEVVFDTKILQDYSESVGNRVLSIDDISGDFNNNARTDAFMSVDSFNLASVRYRKYISFIRDKRFTKERQILLVSALHDDTGNIFLNQYGRVETNTDLGEFGGDLGSFDMDIAGDDGRLLFFPKKFKFNNYDVSNVAVNISDSVAGVGSTGLGGIVNIVSSTTTIPLGITTQHSIVSFATTYRGSKILVAYAASDSSYWEHDEITLVHDGTNVDLVEYGQLTTSNVGSASGEPGLGTYSAYIAGSRVHLDLHPTVSTASTYVANTVHVDFGNASSAGIGTTSLNTSNLDSRYTAISSSGSPSATTVAQYETETFNGAYYVVCVEDTTNSHYQISEVIVVDDGTTAFITEYAINQTVTNLGDFDATISGDNTLLTFTPIASANVQVRVFQAAMRLVDEANTITEIDLENATIDTGFGAYTATETDVKRAFDLKHRQLPIFKRDFVGSASTTVNLSEDSIRLPDHYFVTGEELTYRYTGAGTTSAIEIESQAITGYGTTDKMPSKVFAVKVDDSTIRLATSAENALKSSPTYLDITAVGIGTSHSFTSTKQNSRCILSIDNVVQSPIVSTAVTTTITADVSATTDKIKISGITSITGGDMLKIGDEIMKVDSVGLGATNVLLVTRPWMGTQSTLHTDGTLITKVEGAYNIVDSTVNFYTAPVGLTPLSTTTNEPDERDFVGIATHSTFNARSFMRSGITGSSDEPYAGNYIFDDVSSNFTGLTTEFTLKSDGSDIAGFSTNNALILVNQVPQGPQRYSGSVAIPGDFTLIESAGITSVQFTGSISSVSYDPNTANVPLGGVIVSVGSTEGLGYQPLVAAGGTVVVSGLGTISSVSIGNSGSGYRTGIQTIVNVGVQTLSTGAPNIEFIGTAAISGGNIVSVAITNPGTGYTSTNPPLVVIDEPLSYSNMPLFYSSNQSGVGSEARANVVVGLGGSIIDFEIINQGYGYGETQKLTIGVGGTVGIPTAGATEFREFQLTVQETISDSFAGWTVGDFQVLDPLDALFDGKAISFALNLDGVQQSIQSKPGSNIDVEVALLVFINDILQVPGDGYEFKGGSYITFKEAPKEGDTSKILFYRGTGSVDVSNVDILETIKKGDEIKIYDQNIDLEENLRIVSTINSADSVNTNLYAGPGITTNENFERSVTWSKQTEDKFIDGAAVTKDRPHYEPSIYPNTNIIQSVGVGSTVIFVSNIRTFFDSTKENYNGQNDIRIISQDSVVGASATALVSDTGTISSFDITNPGVGYTIAPTVSISLPIGLSTSQGAQATATISGVGTVNAISVSYGGTTTGFAYTNTAAPSVLIGEPKLITSIETIKDVSYSGDFGIISGISTTSVGVASTAIVFDLLLPKESLFRDASIVGSALTVSGITTGYYFTVFNSNVGASVTSLYQNGTVVGIGTSFLDNVYEVAQVSIAQTMGIGIGLTYVAQVTVSVQDYNGLTGLGHSEFFGEYSWGRIATQPRGSARVFTSYAGDSTGLSGISSSPIIERLNPLRYVNYNT
jgi:hypothetical protein